MFPAVEQRLVRQVRKIDRTDIIPGILVPCHRQQRITAVPLSWFSSSYSHDHRRSHRTDRSLSLAFFSERTLSIQDQQPKLTHPTTYMKCDTIDCMCELPSTITSMSYFHIRRESSLYRSAGDRPQTASKTGNLLIVVRESPDRSHQIIGVL